ncbi:hypothetical protein ACAG24_013770 [Mycobacterium sp. pW049]|uniref:hypothetical protein n=1 Tax=[Mycobacterium] bulgaricum TaxID=3238985 RepID=UPI00351BB053
MALLVGVVGLFAPVSAAANGTVIACGSAVAPDLSAARANDDASPANVPVLGEVVSDANFTRLCDMNLEDRRLWASTCAGLGLIAAAGAAVTGLMSRRNKTAT